MTVTFFSSSEVLQIGIVLLMVLLLPPPTERACCEYVSVDSTKIMLTQHCITTQLPLLWVHTRLCTFKVSYNNKCGKWTHTPEMLYSMRRCWGSSNHSQDKVAEFNVPPLMLLSESRKTKFLPFVEKKNTVRR